MKITKTPTQWLLILLLIGAACRMDGLAPEEATASSSTSEAILRWEGAYEVDGCGFFVELREERYKPANEEAIDASYKVSSSTGARVIITYRILETTIQKYCGDLPEPTTTPGIRLLSLDRN